MPRIAIVIVVVCLLVPIACEQKRPQGPRAGGGTGVAPAPEIDKAPLTDETPVPFPPEVTDAEEVTGQLVFASTRVNNRHGIFRIDLADLAGGVTEIGIGSSPDVSPDGTKIAFSRFYNDDGEVDVCVMNSDGSGVQRLTNAAGMDTHPKWAPDGASIVFSSQRDDNIEVYRMAADGSGQQRLTTHDNGDASPAWSPDGKRIVFIAGRDREAPGVFMMQADGGRQRRLVPAGINAESPVWSPDGIEVAFLMYHRGARRLCAVNLETNTARRIADNALSLRTPAWSPDGLWLSVSRTLEGGREDIWLVRADGSASMRVTDNRGSDWSASWIR